MELQYEKIPIFPLTRYLEPEEQRGIPSRKIPYWFEFKGQKVSVDKIIVCERMVSRKVGGRGFRFTCRVSWTLNEQTRTKNSIVWYDDFLDEWFVEVQKPR